jgi:hypothetical protein
VKLTGFLIATLSMTGACSVALAFADPAPQIAEAAPVVVVSTPAIAIPAPAEDIVVEAVPPPAITPWQRLGWFDQKTFGISNLGGSIPGAALTTFLNRPHESGPHWEGFGERYGNSLATNGASNALEAGLGAIWGEDPRYRRDGSRVAFKSRFGHAMAWTVVAPDRNGDLRPAYARFIAISGSSVISNAWREPSDTTAEHTLSRVAFGFLGRMASNTFDEFWPDAKRKLFHRGSSD